MWDALRGGSGREAPPLTKTADKESLIFVNGLLLDILTILQRKPCVKDSEPTQSKLHCFLVFVLLSFLFLHFGIFCLTVFLFVCFAFIFVVFFVV